MQMAAACTRMRAQSGPGTGFSNSTSSTTRGCWNSIAFMLCSCHMASWLVGQRMTGIALDGSFFLPMAINASRHGKVRRLVDAFLLGRFSVTLRTRVAMLHMHPVTEAHKGRKLVYTDPRN